jgi:hypothetical protein
MKPSSFCCLSTYGCHQELFGLLLSLSIHHPNSNVYCLVDTKTKQSILSYTPKLKLNVKWVENLNKYSGLNRQQMTEKGIWSDFQMMKAYAIHEALKYEKDTLFLDADILVLDTIDNIEPNKKLGVSPHFIKKSDTDRYGYYNGGVLWTNQKTLKDDWILFTKTSRYFDQASIEDLAKKYDYFEFGENYNFSWWRVTQSSQNPETIIKNVSIKNKKLMYKGKSLKFVHTHFHEKRSDIAYFNQIILSGLIKIKDYKSIAIISRMVKQKWIIQLPKQPMSPPWNHSNDSFRELLILIMKNNKDVKLELNNKSGHIWLDNNVLLYDRPTSLWFNNEINKANALMLGNCDVKIEGKILKKSGVNVMPWIFWPRRPMILENLLSKTNLLSFSERKIESIFIGNFENSVQQKFRNTEDKWDEVLTEYHCTAGSKHKFTQEQYLDKLRNTRYGLCLRGYGSKCHREVELMAFGTVPIITPEVSIESFLDPPKENIHYIKVSSPSEMVKKIKKIKKEDWEKMSKSCYEWYQRNVHSKNTWNNTISFLLSN